MIGIKYYRVCSNCEARINDGEDYYDFDGEYWCESCGENYISDHRHTLDIEGELADRMADRLYDNQVY